MNNNLNIRNWVLTPHAVARIEERKVSLSEVEEVVKNPDSIRTQGPKYILAKEFPNRTDNKIACIVLERKEDNLWVVITVMNNFQERESGA